MKGPERGQYNYVRPNIFDIKMRLRQICNNMNLDLDQYFTEQLASEIPPPNPISEMTEEQSRQFRIR